MPPGQTPHTIMLFSHNDLVDAVQPGDRYCDAVSRSFSKDVAPRFIHSRLQILGMVFVTKFTTEHSSVSSLQCLGLSPSCVATFFSLFRVTVSGIYRATPMRVNPRQRNVKAVYKTYIDVIHFKKTDKKRLYSKDPDG